jgi:hypothetical protein
MNCAPVVCGERETMLTINAKQGSRLCDGVTRRRFLEVGSLSVFGLSLADLLRRSAAGADASAGPPGTALRGR